MDETVEGGKTEEIQAPQEAPAEVAEKAAAENPPAEKPPAGPRKSHDWKLIALVVVSCVAVLLLVATITLAATGDFGHSGGHQNLKGFGNRRWGQGPMFRDRDGLRPGFPRQWDDQQEKGNDTPPDLQPATPSDTAPVPVPQS